MLKSRLTSGFVSDWSGRGCSSTGSQGVKMAWAPHSGVTLCTEGCRQSPAREGEVFSRDLHVHAP